MGYRGLALTSSPKSGMRAGIFAAALPGVGGNGRPARRPGGGAGERDGQVVGLIALAGPGRAERDGARRPTLSAVLLDHAARLWNRGQQPEYKAIPRHRARSVFY